MTPAFITAAPLSPRPSRTLSIRTVARPAPRLTHPRRRARLAAPPLLPRAALDPLVLTEENVNVALAEVKEKLGSMFGNSSENLAVGITGDVELATTDGPIVVLRLTGRFWHKRSDVVARVGTYLQERIPEICDVEIEDPRQLEDSEEEGARMS